LTLTNKKNKKLICDEDFAIIFLNLKELLTLHREFLNQLEEKMNDFPMVNFGKTIDSQVPSFVIYKNFVNKYDIALSKMKELQKNNKEIELFAYEAKKKTPGLLGFQSLFIQPVQRLPRYCLLLKELIKNTAEHHVDYEDFKHAKVEIENVLFSINESKKKVEHARALVRAQGLTKLLPEGTPNVQIKDLIRDGFGTIEFSTKTTKSSLSNVLQHPEQVISKRLSGHRLSFSKSGSAPKLDDAPSGPRKTKYLMVLFQNNLIIFDCKSSLDKKSKKNSTFFKLGKEEKKVETNGFYDKFYDDTFYYHSRINLTECEMLTVVESAIETGNFLFESIDQEKNETTLYNLGIEDVLGGNQVELWYNDIFKQIEKTKDKK
jgi:hypothetical protein